MSANEIIRIFYSTTDEEYTEKYKDIFKNLAKSVGAILDVHLEVLTWRDMPGGQGTSGQDVIDEFMAGNYQIYVGVMGTKFGAGTEHEYRTAIEAHIKCASPAEIFFGFCEEPINPYNIDIKTFKKVLVFRKDIGKTGKYALANLYTSFSGEPEFRERFTLNLKKAVENVKGRVAGGFVVK
ncbi:hypothetical protein [Methylobacterium bullatum]|uniref:hypothetical protein n=1 Tax=Methylobacterium bullatum TaxID=570505 RepID=UPI0030D48819